MEEQKDIDDYKNDPSFEPKRKKQKMDEELISNELMHYIIHKFGRDFFSQHDKKERKMMAEAISEDLMNEKSVSIAHETIYSNLVTKKRLFLSEKKRLNKGTINHVYSQFFEAFVALGDCIQPESKEKTSNKKDKKSRESRKAKSVDVSLNQSAGLGQLFTENVPENFLTKGSIENASTSSYQNEVFTDNQNNINTINVPVSSSKVSPPTSPISLKDEDNITPTRSVYNLPRGYFFDNSIDIRDKMKLFFGSSDSKDTNSEPNYESKEEDLKSDATELEKAKEQDTAMKSKENIISDSAENVQTNAINYSVKEQEESGNNMINQDATDFEEAKAMKSKENSVSDSAENVKLSAINFSAKEQEESGNPMITQDTTELEKVKEQDTVMKSEENSVPDSATNAQTSEIQKDSHNESGQKKENNKPNIHANLNPASISYLEMIDGLVSDKYKDDDEIIGENNLIMDESCILGIPMDINDENNGQEEMTQLKTQSDDNNNEKADVTKNIDKENPKESENKKIEKANENVDISEQLKQLSDIMETHESLIAKLMSIDDQRVQLQCDILESDVKYKAVMVEIFKKFNKP